MTRTKPLVLCALVFLLATAYQPLPVEGHAPGPVTLAYDTETQVLTVTATHNVPIADLSWHYVYEVVIEKNAVQYTTRDYLNQTNSAGLVDTFNVSATAGDILRATAKCIVTGQGAGQLTVPGATTTITTTTTNQEAPSPIIMILLAVLIVFGIVAVLVMIAKRR